MYVEQQTQSGILQGSVIYAADTLGYRFDTGLDERCTSERLADYPFWLPLSLAVRSGVTLSRDMTPDDWRGCMWEQASPGTASGKPYWDASKLSEPCTKYAKYIRSTKCIVDVRSDLFGLA